LKEPRHPLIAEIKPLTDEQATAVETVRVAMKDPSDPSPVFLLKGVTGSGKTEVYLELARDVLAQGKGVLFLVPEIALTHQLVSRVERGLGEKVAEWHSGLSDGKRRDVSAYLRSGKLRVVIGARSALFAPVQNLGLIIVDEEHDATFKQEDRVRYQARDLSVVRAKLEKVPLILGSATPSLESLERVREGKYRFIELKNRFSKQGLPELEMISLREEPLVEGIQAMITERTRERIQETLDRGEQVLVFLNRRGYAPFLLCEACGQVDECPNCSISLTFHIHPRSIKCHLCGYRADPPEECSKCHSIEIHPKGAGTESLEDDLPKLFAGVTIDRLDRDSVTSQKRLDEILTAFRDGRTQLLTGT
ncbi:MAG: primosomal protein N', partial [Proteobacteria bacterium]